MKATSTVKPLGEVILNELELGLSLYECEQNICRLSGVPRSEFDIKNFSHSSHDLRELISQHNELTTMLAEFKKGHVGFTPYPQMLQEVMTTLGDYFDKDTETDRGYLANKLEIYRNYSVTY